MTASKTTKTSQAKTNAFAPAFNMPEFDLQNFGESFREMAENGVKQQADDYGKFQKVAEDTTAAMDKIFNAAQDAQNELSAKVIANAKTNAEAGSAFIEKLSGVKSISEALEIQSSFFRSQFDVVSSQYKETQEMSAVAGEKLSSQAKAAFEKAVA